MTFLVKHRKSETALTKGVGIMKTAINAKRVFPHLYVRTANICWENRGKAMPKRLPNIEGLQKVHNNKIMGIGLRKRLWPAEADDANGP